MRIPLLVFFLSLTVPQAYSQVYSLFGSVKSGADTSGVAGAAVRLEGQPGTPSASSAMVAISSSDGTFRFEKVLPGKYTIRIDYLGFEPFAKTIRATENTNLGIIFLPEASLTLDGVQVTGAPALGKQMGDTTQFNASAFKTSHNANAENLIEKMPGIQVLNGQVQAQGETVQEILVDGKPFFEGDVEAALKNLPAEIIQNIQVFDKQSDQAEFSGFDDGNKTKAINIVTKPDRRRGQFGQASLGYGTDQRYMAGASVNFFNNERRITVTGVSNDINSSGYSIGETPGGELRGGSEGNATTNRISVNYNDEWGEQLELSGNYSYHHRQNISQRLQFRDYILSSDSGQIYSEENNRNSTWAGQRFRMRLEYDPNKENEIVIEPRFSIEQDDGISYFLGHTANDRGPVNQTENNSSYEGSELEFENEIHYRHRFTKKGRTFSTRLETAIDRDKRETYRLADNSFYNREDPHETLDQFINPDNRQVTWDLNFSYTEPVGDSARVEIEYGAGNNRNNSNEQAFNFAAGTGDYSRLDTLLSNTFENNYLSQEIEAGYQYSTQQLNVELEVEYQQASLENSQVFPKTYNMERTFHSLQPSVEVEYRFSDSENLRLDYRTDTDNPSMGQLQEVIHNANPLHIRTGNPDLKQSYRNELSLRYKSFDTKTNKLFYARIEGSVTNNTISNSTIIAEKPIQLSEDIVLEQGSQFTRPVNLAEGNWDVRTHVSYGQPVPFIASNLELNGSAGYFRRPGMINDKLTISSTNNFGVGISLSSNISEKIDFNISTRSGYRIVENTVRPQLNTNYFNQSTHFSGDFVFWKGVILRTELNHRVNSGALEGYDSNFLLWNLSISKLLFERERGEICLAINDLLKQNNSIERNVTELYIEDERTNMLQQFFMLSFTYSIRNFGGG